MSRISKVSDSHILHHPDPVLSEAAHGIIAMLSGHKRASAEAAKTATGTPEEQRLRGLMGMIQGRHAMDESAAMRPLPAGVSVSPVLADGIPCEWQRWLDDDPEKQKEKVILFLHGGGFSGGSALTRRPMSTRLVERAKIDALSVDYRLSPEYRFPAALDDCETAYVWLLKQGYKPENILVTGESAGANLTVALIHYLRAHSLPLPGMACPFSPVVDLADSYPSHVLRANRDPMIGPLYEESEIPVALEKLKTDDVAQAGFYCDAETRKSPFASPIFGDFHGFPKLMIHVGSEEILYDDAIALHDAAKAAGVDVVLHEWEGLFHSFPIFDFPEAAEACSVIATFVRDGV